MTADPAPATLCLRRRRTHDHGQIHVPPSTTGTQVDTTIGQCAPPLVSRKSSLKLVSTKTYCIMHSHTPPIYPSARSLLPERRLWSSPRAGEDSSRFGRTGRSGHRGTSWDFRPISATTTLQGGGLGGRKGQVDSRTRPEFSSCLHHGFDPAQ
ncbi:hypothetical protein SMAC4_13324 [Sordaria macrospora]|uniref:uncharacterized protein n=1 Tax=Sordaria macrospora TaxID=5147 RepID=UPI002B2A24FD|nr:hypothetical protein SMAC4_13324 [Sordaria macrospora]